VGRHRSRPGASLLTGRRRPSDSRDERRRRIHRALTEDNGTVVVAAGRDLVLLRPTGDTSHLVTVGDVVDGGILNDCRCDPAGDLWVGVTTEGETESIAASGS